MTKVFVVDDDKYIVSQIVEFLSQQAMQVKTAKCSTTALHEIREWQPDIIILDYHMPGYNGYEVYTSLRNDPACKEIPVIFITSEHSQKEIIEAVAARTTDFLAKPFALRDLAEAIIVQEGLASFRRESKPAEDKINELMAKYGQTT